MTEPDVADGSEPWRDIAHRKRQLQVAALNSINVSIGDQTHQNSNGCEDAVTVIKTPGEIATLIRSEKATCKTIVTAFMKRAKEVHQLTNCLTEILFDEALDDAARLDEYYTTKKELIGPLHGVIVTLKDQFDVKGFDSTIGYVGRCFKPAVEDAALVKILRNLGAVVIAKTNLPQSIMWCETENPLWGLTTHPMNKSYTPGGSTGGEGVLLASKGSMLGWGTDIGGSIRIPSMMMGLYGLKPSSARLPYKGVPVSTNGQEHVPSSVGPMSQSLDMIYAATRAVVDAQPWKTDARCAPIPWREQAYHEAQSRPLTIGVLFDDNVVRPHPPMARVLRNTVNALRAAGHEILEWNADLHAECVAVMDQFYTVDGGQDIRDAVMEGGEPFIPHVEKLINSGKPISVYDYWKLNRQKWELQQKYLEKWDTLRSPISGNTADVILMPPMPHSAVPHRSCRWVGYTKVWNFLDYPALVIPTGFVSEEDLRANWGFAARNEKDEWTGKLWEDYGAEMASLKLSVGVQLICRKLEEEKLLGIAKVVDELLE